MFVCVGVSLCDDVCLIVRWEILCVVVCDECVLACVRGPESERVSVVRSLVDSTDDCVVICSVVVDVWIGLVCSVVLCCDAM